MFSLTRKRWVKVLLVSLIGFMVVLLVFLHVAVSFSLSDEDVLEAFEEAGVVFELQEIDGVTYVETGNPDGPPILFVHGSPGSWDNFISYLLNAELREEYRLISVNRIGFGGASSGDPEASLVRHAEAVMQVLPEDQTAVLVGHSMGGPVVAQAAMLFPERVKGLVLLSAAVDPDLERVMAIQYVGAFPLISWVLPSCTFFTRTPSTPRGFSAPMSSSTV